MFLMLSCLLNCVEAQKHVYEMAMFSCVCTENDDGHGPKILAGAQADPTFRTQKMEERN